MFKKIIAMLVLVGCTTMPDPEPTSSKAQMTCEDGDDCNGGGGPGGGWGDGGGGGGGETPWCGKSCDQDSDCSSWSSSCNTCVQHECWVGQAVQ